MSSARGSRAKATVTGRAERPSAAERLHPSPTQHAFLQLRLLARHLRLEANLVRSGIVLDIGCGAQPYKGLFRGPYVGIDLSARHGRPDALANADALPIRPKSVATVVSTQQLEHVADPVAVLREARGVLQPDGTLLLSTHGVWVHHPDPHDYWRWTEEGLVKLLSDQGFVVERVHRQGEIITAATVLLLYPISSMRGSRFRVTSKLAAATIAVSNGLALGLDWIAARAFPRHLGSASYLVVARPSDGVLAASNAR